MIEYENDCVGCSADYYPCDPHCRRKRTPHYYCDCCGEEDELYWFDDKQLCIACVKAELERVDEEE